MDAYQAARMIKDALAPATKADPVWAKVMAVHGDRCNVIRDGDETTVPDVKVLSSARGIKIGDRCLLRLLGRELVVESYILTSDRM